MQFYTLLEEQRAIVDATYDLRGAPLGYYALTLSYRRDE